MLYHFSVAKLDLLLFGFFPLGFGLGWFDFKIVVRKHEFHLCIQFLCELQVLVAFLVQMRLFASISAAFNLLCRVLNAVKIVINYLLLPSLRLKSWLVHNQVAFYGPRPDQLLALAFEFIHRRFFRDLIILAEFELVPELLALLR